MRGFKASLSLSQLGDDEHIVLGLQDPVLVRDHVLLKVGVEASGAPHLEDLVTPVVIEKEEHGVVLDIAALGHGLVEFVDLRPRDEKALELLLTLAKDLLKVRVLHEMPDLDIEIVHGLEQPEADLASQTVHDARDFGHCGHDTLLCL